MSQRVPAHAGHAHKHVAAFKDGCLLDVFSRGVHTPTIPVMVGQALHGHQGTHVQVPALKTLIQPPHGLVCATPSCLQALCLLPSFCLSFIFPLLFAAVLMNIAWPRTSMNPPPRLLPAPSAGTSPIFGGLGGTHLLGSHLRGEDPGREGSSGSAALRHSCTCPLLSPVCHQPPQPSERAVSSAHLPVAQPPLLHCAGALLSVGLQQRHRGTAQTVGQTAAWAALGPCASKLEVLLHSPKTCWQAAGVWVREAGNSVALQSP